MKVQWTAIGFWWRIAGALLILALILASCLSGAENQSEQLNGTVLLWHDLGEEDTRVLDQVLANFMDIHPDVRVTATSIPEDLLRQRFEDAVDSGLGPDLLLGPSSWIRPLADSGRIQSIETLVEPQFWDQYIPTAITTTQYNGQHYGIPESLRMMGLYYNKAMVEAPATTLDELMVQVEQGVNIGMSPAFIDLFWGIRAFGGELLDENGQVVLDRGGFANWLAWLVTAKDGPHFLIDRDRKTLRTLFGDGELAYLIDGSWAARELGNAIGQNRLGVAPLPAGPIGVASPLLQANAFMLSVASSPRQAEVAVDLARFITNPEQATTLMRRGDRIPASDLIQVSPSVDPIAFPFITQARNAIPFQNSLVMDTVLEVGAGAYNKALQGVQGPVEVANTITQEINDALGIASERAAMPECQRLGVLDIWYAKDITDERTIQVTVEHFRSNCPYVVVSATGHEADTLREMLISGEVQTPDVALIPSQWIAALTEQGSIRSLTGMISAETLQAYQPPAVQSWMIADRLYGVPFSLELSALYYNKALVTDPARTLRDLVTEGAAERTTALNIGFDQAYWGIPAFGGALFDEESKVVLDQGGFIDWLVWLQDAYTKAGASLETDDRPLLNQFQKGQVSYYVGGPDALTAAEHALGAENVGVTRLPTGPIADAAPLLTSQGFVVPNSITSGDISQEALLFIQDATGLEAQQLLMETARKVPVNVAVDYSADPAITGFLERASNAAVYPNGPEMAAARDLGARLYAAVVKEPARSTVELEALIAEITAEINIANGFLATDEDGEAPAENESPAGQ